MTNDRTDLHREIFNRKLFQHVSDLRDGDTLDADEGLKALLYVEAKTLDIEALEAWCESPIETMMGAALCWAIDGYNTLEMLNPSLYEMITGKKGLYDFRNDFKTFFAPQVTINDYRLDFLIACCCHGSFEFVAIECDGHDYHERSKGQASRDKKRDRKLTGLGIPTLRFTGSDIHYKLDECIEEIEGFLFNIQEKMLVKEGLVTAVNRGAAA